MGATKACSSSAVSGAPCPEYAGVGVGVACPPISGGIVIATRMKHRVTDNAFVFAIFAPDVIIINFLSSAQRPLRENQTRQGRKAEIVTRPSRNHAAFDHLVDDRSRNYIDE